MKFGLIELFAEKPYQKHIIGQNKTILYTSQNMSGADL